MKEDIQMIGPLTGGYLGYARDPKTGELKALAYYDKDGNKTHDIMWTKPRLSWYKRCYKRFLEIIHSFGHSRH